MLRRTGRGLRLVRPSGGGLHTLVAVRAGRLAGVLSGRLGRGSGGIIGGAGTGTRSTAAPWVGTPEHVTG